jgi:hypothetical protein
MGAIFGKNVKWRVVFLVAVRNSINQLGPIIQSDKLIKKMSFVIATLCRCEIQDTPTKQYSAIGAIFFQRKIKI